MESDQRGEDAQQRARAPIWPPGAIPSQSLLVLVEKLVGELLAFLIDRVQDMKQFTQLSIMRAAAIKRRRNRPLHHFVNLVLFPHRRLAKERPRRVGSSIFGF
jgi:hypothetical protein